MSIASFYIDYGIDPSDPNHLDSFLSGLAEGHTDGGWVYSAEHAGDDSDYDDSNSDNSYYGGGGSSSGHSDTHASSESLDRRAKAEGWKRQNTKSTARMQSWKRGNDRINYWPTTGTMSTRIKHPNRKHPQQMYRRKVDTELAKQIISNPRKHTGKGYYTKNKRSRQKHGGNDSTGSSSSTTSERKRKKRKRRR